jgi:hypothetical protein
MKTANATRYQDSGEKRILYYDWSRHLISVQTCHYTLFRWYIIHEVALVSLNKKEQVILGFASLIQLYYKKT